MSQRHDPVLDAARDAWETACEVGEKHGFRNAQSTVLAPTGTIGFMMDCDTTGIEPDIALIKYKKLVGGGMMKIVNGTVPLALEVLGYSDAERKIILQWLEEQETIEGAPGLKPEHLPVFDCAFRAAKGSRSEALARELETKARDAVATLQQLSEADWRKVTEAEKWPVGVTAHHYASVLEAITGTIDTVASGRPFESFTPGLIDEMNARHARDYAACTRAETIELFQKGVAVAAAAIRRLSDEQLGRSAKVMSTMPPMTLEQLITGGLLGHMDEHIGSIKKTVGH